MAISVRTERIVGNPGYLAFGKKKSSKRGTSRPSAHRSNPGGEIIGFTLANTGKKRSPMAHTAKKPKKSKQHHSKKPGGYAKTKFNPGKMAHHHHKKGRKNPGVMGGGLGPMVTNALFVIVGALGSKLGAQAVLGTNNSGLMGYAANAAVGGALWFLSEKVMHNRAASSGIIAGTIVQILLRIINDYTPFGSYVAQLGMGDYQMQSFVTPQVLVDPWRNADIQIPAGWGGGMVAATAAGAPMAAMPAVAAAAGGGGRPGMGGLYGGRGGPRLYGAAA